MSEFEPGCDGVGQEIRASKGTYLQVKLIPPRALKKKEKKPSLFRK